MGFFQWFYNEGIRLYLYRWIYVLKSFNHYFSFRFLVKYLFAPYKRLIIGDEKNFNIKLFFEQLSFNLVSRFMGAIVRSALLLAGIVSFVLVFFIGFLGMIIWIIFPVFALPAFIKKQKSPKAVVERILKKIQTGKKSFEDIIFKSEAGKFVLIHTNIDYEELKTRLKGSKVIPENFHPVNFKELIDFFLENSPELDGFFREKDIKKEDFSLAASWWDRKGEKEKENYYGPGIGRSLLFGFTPMLNQYVEDLGTPRSFSHHLIGRGTAVSQIERVLSAGNSVMLMGEPGVGKKTVILEFAKKAWYGEIGANLSYRRILDFDYNFLLSESTDINQKKSKLSQILAEASYAGNIILVISDIHRIVNQEAEGVDFTDVLEKYLDKRELKLIAIETPYEYEKFIASNGKIRKYFENVKVVPPSQDEAMLILADAAKDIEEKSGILVSTAALRKIWEGSDEYITDTPFPEKALELLDEVVIHKTSQGGLITPIDVNHVLSEKTGISFTDLDKKESEKLSNLETIIHEKLVNQEVAVSLIAKTLRSRVVGIKSKKRPIGSFLFLGPTGVGKTQTAKVLSRVYYGSEEKILRFDMAEYGGKEGLERIMGSVEKGEPGILTSRIKEKPASLLLLDEFEKSRSEVYNLFLTLLDEGQITDAFGRKINCNHLFVVATSNAGSSYIRELVSRGVHGEKLQSEVLDYIQKQNIFSPEFLNRFDGVVVFEPLTREHLLKVSKLMFGDLAEDMLAKKNVILTANENTYLKLVEDGYDPVFGARPMRRVLEIFVGDLLGKAIIQGEIKSGDKIELKADDGKNQYRWEKVS